MRQHRHNTNSTISTNERFDFAFGINELNERFKANYMVLLSEEDGIQSLTLAYLYWPPFFGDGIDVILNRLHLVDPTGIS